LPHKSVSRTRATPRSAHPGARPREQGQPTSPTASNRRDQSPERSRALLTQTPTHYSTRCLGVPLGRDGARARASRRGAQRKGPGRAPGPYGFVTPGPRPRDSRRRFRPRLARCRRPARGGATVSGLASLGPELPADPRRSLDVSEAGELALAATLPLVTTPRTRRGIRPGPASPPRQA
jgi:hypothetical protein